MNTEKEEVTTSEYITEIIPLLGRLFGLILMNAAIYLIFLFLVWIGCGEGFFVFVMCVIGVVVLGINIRLYVNRPYKNPYSGWGETLLLIYLSLICPITIFMSWFHLL